MTGVAPVDHTATPELAFRLDVANAVVGEAVHGVLLRCQLRIEPQLRAYSDAEAAGLDDLFGARERWERTVKPMLWTHATAMVPAFTGALAFELPVVCTYDFNQAVARYFHALVDGEVPVILLFSGTVFYAGASGAMQVGQVPWSCEARYRMPVAAWKTLMDRHYPNVTSVALRRDVFDRLDRYRREHRCADLDQALESLLGGRA